MHHDIADLQLFEIKQTAQLVAVFLDQRLIAMQHFNSATQFFLRRKHRTASCQINPKQSQDHPNNPVYQPRNRTQHCHHR